MAGTLIPLREFWKRIHAATSAARAWQALYMGDPTPDEGVYFERKWLQRGVPPAKETMKNLRRERLRRDG